MSAPRLPRGARIQMLGQVLSIQHCSIACSLRSQHVGTARRAAPRRAFLPAPASIHDLLDEARSKAMSSTTSSGKRPSDRGHGASHDHHAVQQSRSRRRPSEVSRTWRCFSRSCSSSRASSLSARGGSFASVCFLRISPRVRSVRAFSKPGSSEAARLASRISLSAWGVK